MMLTATHNLKKGLIFILLITFSKSLQAQTNSNQIEFSGIYGANTFCPDFTVQGQIHGGELVYHLNMQNSTLGYLKALNIKYIDFAGSYRSLQSLIINHDPTSKGLLGDAYSFIGRLDIQLLQTGPFKFYFTPGFGFTYSTVSYFSNNNPIVGSKLNLTSQAGLKLVTNISPSTGIVLGTDFLHYSNSGERTPNNGINTINYTLGLIQNLNISGPTTPNNPFIYTGLNSFFTTIDIGFRGQYQSKNEYVRNGLFVGYSRTINSVFSLETGLDLGHYFTTFDPYNWGPTNENYASSLSHWRLGLSIGGEARLGRLGVFTDYGYNLYFDNVFISTDAKAHTLNNHVKFYLNPGFRYYVSQKFAFQIKQYTNKQAADYLGMGILFRTL